MDLSLRFAAWWRQALLLCALATPTSLRAQDACLLVPVPLAQRVQQATLVVEARVASQQTEVAPSGHLVTRHVLAVYKVFRGALPAGPLSVLTQGGTLGEQREEVTGSLQVALQQQGVFLLEADPAAPGEWRTYAGPQGFIRYDLASLAASEPFGHYAAIATDLYPALAGAAGGPYRTRQPNPDLAASAARLAAPRRLAAPVTIDSFTPTVVTAGTSTSTTNPTATLSINGSGFGAAQGAGFVEFLNANSPTDYLQPLASDYVSWSDTQIQVRVPATNNAGGTAGTGPIRVTNSDGSSRATSGSPLTVSYVVSNVVSGGTTYRVRLVDTDAKGGYTLQYSSVSLPAVAQAPFAAALQSWLCNTGMNRTLGDPTPSDAVSGTDNVNIVRFDNGTELPAGVLGITRTYFSGCVVGGVAFWRLTGTDYTFDSGTNWYYGPDPAGIGSSQYDFQSVALHELGHGQLLGHIIRAGAVMNFSIGNSQVRRTLSADNDLAGGRDEIAYSTALADPCGASVFTTSTCPLPVQLTAFGARYQSGRGTLLSWATATELNSASFVVESQSYAPDSTWQAVARVAAAGHSTTPRQYQALDARPLAGTRYYRLRQLDLDGTVAFSPVVSVAAAATALAAYPNPATGRVQLSGPLAAGATAQVRLLDATGRCLLRTAGPAGQADFALPLAGVPAGFYLVEWDGGAGLAHLRLLVH